MRFARAFTSIPVALGLCLCAETASAQATPRSSSSTTEEVYTEEIATPDRGLIAGGIVVFGMPYLTSVVVAGESQHVGDNQLYIPVAGPWLDLNDRGGCPRYGSCDDETTNKVMLVTDGILQGIGMMQLVGAFLFPEHHTVLRTTSMSEAKLGADKATGSRSMQLSISPGRVGPGAYGLTAVGRF